MILRILLRYLWQFWSFLGHFRVDKVIQKLKIRQSQAAMQVVILITDGREQGNTLDYEAEEAKKGLDSLSNLDSISKTELKAINHHFGTDRL